MLAPAAGPGGFNDPDALIIGQNSLGVAGMKLQMSLWVTLAAPLLIGADLRSLSTDARAVLQNPQVRMAPRQHSRCAAAAVAFLSHRK